MLIKIARLAFKDKENFFLRKKPLTTPNLAQMITYKLTSNFACAAVSQLAIIGWNQLINVEVSTV